MLLWKTGCQHSEHVGSSKPPWQDDWQLFYSTPLFPPHQSLHRFEESALQASGRCAEECQETLWWSEPAAGEQRRSGHVTRGTVHVLGGEKMVRMCVTSREGETGGRMQIEGWISERWQVVATIETSMYIYYIRIQVIPCLWCRSFSWRTETCVGLNLKCRKGWFTNLRQAKCLNLFLWANVFCLSDLFFLILPHFEQYNLTWL